MNSDQDGYFFVICPKCIETKEIIQSKLPLYSVAIFRGFAKIDEITMIPIKQQKLPNLLAWRVDGKLQFKQCLNKKKWELIKIEVSNEKQMIGMFYISTKQYVKRFEEDNQKFHCEKVKICQAYDLQFELFMGNSLQQVDQLLIQYRGVSDIKTPITKQSRERIQQDSELNNLQVKYVQSQILFPMALQTPPRLLQDYNDIEQQQSVNSLPLTAPVINNFKIELQQVPSKLMSGQSGKDGIMTSTQIQDYRALKWKDKVILLIFGVISLLMIYASMIPIKRI